MGLLLLLAVALAVGGPDFKIEPFGGGEIAVGQLVELNDQDVVVRIKGSRIGEVKADKDGGGFRIEAPFKRGGDGTSDIKISDVRFVEAVATPSRSNTTANSSAASAGKPLENPSVVLETLDGTRLSGAGYEVTKGIARLKLVSGETLEVPTKFIHRVDFALGGKPATWPELPKDAAGDLIVVQKKEAVDLVEGVVGDVSTDTVQFSIEGDVVPVKRAKVIGLVYFHSAQANSLAATKVIVENAAGWRLHATHVALVDGKLATTTTFGATLNQPLDSILKIDFSPSRMDYLSDIAVDSVEWTPFLDFGKRTEMLSQFYKPHFDCALDGGPMMIDKKPYRKGVAMAARTILEYKIAGRGKQFRATAGIDDSVHGAGNVKLTIEGDGKVLYTGNLKGREQAELNFDVSSVKRLRIMADFGGGPDVGNFLDLGDARIVK